MRKPAHFVRRLLLLSPVTHFCFNKRGPKLARQAMRVRRIGPVASLLLAFLALAGCGAPAPAPQPIDDPPALAQPKIVPPPPVPPPVNPPKDKEPVPPPP